MLTRRSWLVASLASTAGAGRLPAWRKYGRVLAPGFPGSRSKSWLSAPSVVKLKDDRLRLYFWAREGGPGYIYAVESAPRLPLDWKLLKPDPMLGPSPIGNFNDKGPGFPFVLRRDDGPWLMYYCGWGSWAPPRKISNRTCLALSYDEGITWTVTKEPLLPLGKPGSHDAGLTGSVYVMRTGPKDYRMWYTAGSHYEDIQGVHRAIAHIGYATSRDGIEWVKHPRAILSPRLGAVTPYEAVVSKPSVLYAKGWYHMWLSVFCMEGRGYRLNYARSKDGINWQRFADDEVLPLSPGEFDSANESYANVIEVNDELWMFYTGNGFGATGIGLATLAKSALSL